MSSSKRSAPIALHTAGTKRSSKAALQTKQLRYAPLSQPAFAPPQMSEPRDADAPSIFHMTDKIRAEVIYSPRNLCYTCHIDSQLFTSKGGEVLMATKKAAAKKPVKKAAAKKKK